MANWFQCYGFLACALRVYVGLRFNQEGLIFCEAEGQFAKLWDLDLNVCATSWTKESLCCPRMVKQPTACWHME